MKRCQGLAQQPLNAFLEADATRADDELNRVYGLLTAVLAKKSATLAALKTSQRAWLIFRDAEVKATGTLFGEGSGRRQVEAGILGSLTRERVAWLLVALAGKAALGSGKEKAAADKFLNALWGKREAVETEAQRAWLGWRNAEASFWSAHAGASAQDAALTRLTWERCRHLSG